MLNKLLLIGRVGKDPQKTTFENGGLIVSFSLATTEKWKDSNGQKQERTEWHNCVCNSEGLGKVIMDYVSKGSQLYIEGSLKTRSWERSGTKHYATEVYVRNLHMLDSRQSQAGNQPAAESSPDLLKGEEEDKLPF